MARISSSKRRVSRRSSSVQKPHGVLHPRVEKVGPRHFGVVCFDCHKAASKWMLAEFYGKSLVETGEESSLRRAARQRRWSWS
jgi:hypothetical protein